MEFEDLTPDTRLELGKHLSGKEMVKLCSVSKTFRDTCSSPKFNQLWKEKIKEDFNYKYTQKDAFDEYLRQSYCNSKSFWMVNVYDDGNIYVFNTEEEAINYVIDDIKDKYGVSLSEILANKVLKNHGEIEVYEDTYYIDKISISKNRKNYEDKYIEFLSQFVKKLGKEDNANLIHDLDQKVTNISETHYRVGDILSPLSFPAEYFKDICEKYDIDCNLLTKKFNEFLNNSLDNLV